MFPISDSQPGKIFPFVNYIIIAFTAFVFYLQLTNPEDFTLAYSLIPDKIDFLNFRTLYPFITSIFLHGGWLHIISNLWFLHIFGDNVEGELGHFFYLFFYLSAGIAGSLLQYFIAPHIDIPMLGASGAIAGVLGAYFYFFPHNKVKTLLPVFGFITFVNVSAYFMLGYWFVLQILSGVVSIPGMGTEQGGVAFWAHIGGFAFGYIVARIFGKREEGVLEGQVI